MNNSLNEKLKTNKGITLIALVITIIVLLILAGVTIVMLTGDNGILSKAQNAKTQNNKKAIEEQIELALLSSKVNPTLAINEQKLREELENYGMEIKNTEGFPLIVEKDGYAYMITATGEVKNNIDNSETKVKTITKTGVFDNSNISEVKEGNIPIPTGYKYIKGDKIGGVVITDAENGQEGVGSEFVWVPVNINSIAQCATAGGNCNLQLDENDGKLKCTNQAHSSTAEEIVGKLYAIDTKNNFGTVNNSYDANTGLREPTIINGSSLLEGVSFDEQNYENAGFTTDGTTSGSDAMLKGLQSEYKKMATSVAKYGGFYVGRYETSLNNATASDSGDSNSTSVQSKAGVVVANATLSKTNMWYGLYKMSKTYVSEENINKSVVSSMMWGSQYDAMLNWMKNNGIDVKSNTPKDLSIGETSRNITRVTGGANTGESASKDKLSNIYDLLGNSREWTLEAYNQDYRVMRGGGWKSNLGLSPSYRGYNAPSRNTEDYAVNGSRLALYIK